MREFDRIKKHKELCELLHETYKKKNADYGNSFDTTYQQLGIISAITRISDKYNRLINLTLNNNKSLVKNESYSDTLLDLANYCIMTAMLIK